VGFSSQESPSSITIADGSTYQKLTFETSLQCVLTAFECVESLGDVLNVDLKEFYANYYGMMMDLPLHFLSDDILLVAIRCFEKMLRDKRQISIDRVIGYVKRLGIVCMNTISPNVIIAFLSIVYHLLIKYPKLSNQFIDNENDRVVSGLPDFFVNEPDYSNSSSTSAWEYSRLLKHYHPVVKKLIKTLFEVNGSDGFCSISSTKLLGISTSQLYSQYNYFLTGTFNPPIPCPKNHPLQSPYQKMIKKSKQRIFHIRPNLDFPSSNYFIEKLQPLFNINFNNQIQKNQKIFINFYDSFQNFKKHKQKELLLRKLFALKQISKFYENYKQQRNEHQFIKKNKN